MPLILDISSENTKERLTSWYGILFVVAVTYLVFSQIQHYVTAKRLGTKKVKYYLNDMLLGFRNFFTIMNAKKEGRMIKVSHSRYEDLGDTYTTKIFGLSMILTRDPENIKALLATQFNDFCLGTRHEHFKPFLGDGIFTLDGEGWKHSRALLRPSFARDQISDVSVFENHLPNLFKQISVHNGRPFDIQELFYRFTVDSSTEFLFGQSVESLKDEAIGMTKEAIDFDGKAGFTEAFNRGQAYLATRALSQHLHFLFYNKQFREDIKTIHKFADFYVKRALETPPEKLETLSNGSYIFLYELVKETRDPIVLRSQLLNILIASRDTTASLLSFTMFELARNKEIWEKLKEEVYERFGDGDNVELDRITFEELKKAEYLKAVLNETLRLYPAVPQNFRVSQKNTTLPRGGGEDCMSPIYVPKGTTVSYSVGSVHRNKATYGEDAEVYRPERWFEPYTRKLGWSYLPFNGGPRICLGQQFALTEASYVLVRLIQTFPNIEPHDTEYPPRECSELTMSLMDGCNISLF